MQKRIYKVLCNMLSLLLVLSLSSCGANNSNSSSNSEPNTNNSSKSNSNQTTDNSETFIFTDSSGREVELPKNIKRVASGGPMANIMIYGINPDVIVGWSSKPGKEAQKYIDQKYWDLPEYGKFFKNSDDFNREALMTSDPEVIIDIGEWNEDYKKELDALQEQTGIPIIIIEANLDQTSDAYRTLGELLGNKERGDQLADYCDKILSDAKEKVASIPDDQKKTIFSAEGETGLSTLIGGTIHAQIIELLGCKVVVEADNVETQRGGGTVSMEQLMAWNPDIIMFAEGSIYDTVENDSTWNALTAIKEGNYFEVPATPYSWIARPPGPNRIIGIRWLGNLLYPEVFDYDIKEEVKEFFSLFYRYDLTDEEITEILQNSTLKFEK